MSRNSTITKILVKSPYFLSLSPPTQMPLLSFFHILDTSTTLSTSVPNIVEHKTTMINWIIIAWREQRNAPTFTIPKSASYSFCLKLSLDTYLHPWSTIHQILRQWLQKACVITSCSWHEGADGTYRISVFFMRQYFGYGDPKDVPFESPRCGSRTHTTCTPLSTYWFESISLM
jgi:hypothetical protein